MLVLAIEWSTRAGSVAILRDGRPLAEAAGAAARSANQEVFRAVRETLSRAAVEPADVALFAVSSGPGAFSGLRMALSAACAMALPGGRPVSGVGSGETIARDVLRGEPGATVAVVGDARRGALWMAQFREEDGLPATVADYRLVAPEALGEAVAPDAVIVTSDWDRIGDVLARAVPPTARLVREARWPSARTLGELALARLVAGGPPPTPRLRYMHPPVAAPARDGR